MRDILSKSGHIKMTLNWQAYLVMVLLSICLAQYYTWLVMLFNTTTSLIHRVTQHHVEPVDTLSSLTDGVNIGVTGYSIILN